MKHRIKIFTTLSAAALLLTSCNTQNTEPDASVTCCTTSAATASETTFLSVPDTTFSTSTETTPSSVSLMDYEEIPTEPYRIIIKEAAEQGIHPAYDLYDFDGDGTDELFISMNESHADGVKIYTLRDNTALRIDTEYYLGSWGTLDIADGGFVKSCYQQGGSLELDFYNFDGEKLNKLISTYLRIHDDGTCSFAVNNIEATEDEYTLAISEYESKEWLTVGRGNFIID